MNLRNGKGNHLYLELFTRSTPWVVRRQLAEELVGKAVEHVFEKEDGEKKEWRGMVLSRAPVMRHWYYITYERDPVLYMYQLWDDYQEGDLRILPEAGWS
ncbi:hypothetical protein ACEWY4_028083 [Coilia grayii]|uniref:Uncharacterized protein n=1 Tax=Coilia grayii TaxID=363190 RepID=A0ABD1IMX0_9TELE